MAHLRAISKLCFGGGGGADSPFPTPYQHLVKYVFIHINIMKPEEQTTRYAPDRKKSKRCKGKNEKKLKDKVMKWF